MSNDKLRKSAEQAEELLAEIVRRHIDDLLPRESFYRECNTAAEALRAALADSATAEEQAYRIAGKMCPTCELPDNNYCRDPSHATADTPPKLIGEMVTQAKVLSAALVIHRDTGRNLCWISGRAVAAHALERFRALVAHTKQEG